jgi:hypothetical protein
MVDFGFRPTFFLFVAAISAFHRHLLRKQGEAENPPVPLVPDRPWLRRLPPLPMVSLPGLIPSPAGSAASLRSTEAPAAGVFAGPPAGAGLIPSAGVPGVFSELRRPYWVKAQEKPKTSIEGTLRSKFTWTRLGIRDFLIMLVLTFATVEYWKHLIKTM